MMKNMVLPGLLVLALLIGCSSKPVHVPVAERVAAEDAAKSREQAARQRDGGIQEEELMRREAERRRLAEDEARMKSAGSGTVLFEYDSYAVRPEYVSVIQQAATWLIQLKGARVVVEGHCDERGTMEYNMALGQKRAEAVKDQLVKMGVEPGRIRTISYGKEMPADPGHNEEAWARNRRATIKAEQ